MSDDRVSEVRAQLVEHVGFTKRYRDPSWTLAQELIWHRRQCLSNFLDEEDDTWLQRNKTLEQLADREGISLVDEQTAREVMAIVAERERRRVETT